MDWELADLDKTYEVQVWLDTTNARQLEGLDMQESRKGGDNKKLWSSSEKRHVSM